MPNLDDPIVLVSIQSFVFLYLICFGIIVMRGLHVAYDNYKQGKSRADWHVAVATLVIALIPILNIFLMFQCLMAFWREGEPDQLP